MTRRVGRQLQAFVMHRDEHRRRGFDLGAMLQHQRGITGDAALMLKHRGKIEATASMLIAMHDESLKLPADAPGHGLIHGWSESDACLAAAPETWWQPYFANSAFAARGLKDISKAWAGFPGAMAKTKEWAR